MNSIAQQQFPVLDMTLALRYQLLDILTDDDLNYALSGNMTLGQLCRQSGECDRIYIEAFKTFKHDWSYQHDSAVETSVDALRGWYAELENEFKAAVSALKEEQIYGQMIERGHGGMQFPVIVNFQVYRESLLIFYAKVSIYLKAMGKDLPGQWQGWIG